MKIRMLVGISGVDFTLSPGEVTEQFGTAEAMRLVSAGYASMIEDEIETAVKAPPAETRKRGKR